MKFPAELLGAEWASPSTYAVYLALKRHVDPRKTEGKAWPGRQRIARLAQVSVRTVQHEIRILKEHGWLDWKSGWADAKAKVKTTNVYTVRDTPSLLGKELPAHSENGARSIEKHIPHDREGAAQEVRTSKQEPEELEPTPQATNRVPDLMKYPDQFEHSWAAYPTRVGGNPKLKAFKAWSARVQNGVCADEIHAGVERYRAYCEAARKIGTEYVKQAATFFGPDEHYLEPWNLPKSDPRCDSRLYPSTKPVRVRSF